MVLVLIENYCQNAERLINSLKKVTNNIEYIVLNYNGFLAKGLHSPILDYLLDEDDDLSSGALFYNKVPIDSTWDLENFNLFAEIRDYNRLRGKVQYSTNRNKLVSKIEWYNENGKVNCVDHYNNYGFKYAQTLYNEDSQAILTSYFNKKGKEIILHNHVTDSIMLKKYDVPLFFNGYYDFVNYYLKNNNFDLDIVLYNSLGSTFMIAEDLANNIGKLIYFCQEDFSEEIPFNLKVTLEENYIHTTKVIVDNIETFNKIGESSLKNNMIVEKLGYIYDFKKEHSKSNNILIFTDSDIIYHIDKIIKSLPNFIFHVAAETEMSLKLLELKQYDNVKIYQNVSGKYSDELVAKCDILLDIATGEEVYDMSRKSFENNLLIYSFEETTHNKIYTPKNHIFKYEDVDKLILLLNEEYLVNAEDMIKSQRESIGSVSILDYNNILK